MGTGLQARPKGLQAPTCTLPTSNPLGTLLLSAPSHGTPASPAGRGGSGRRCCTEGAPQALPAAPQGLPAPPAPSTDPALPARAGNRGKGAGGDPGDAGAAGPEEQRPRLGSARGTGGWERRGSGTSCGAWRSCPRGSPIALRRRPRRCHVRSPPPQRPGEGVFPAGGCRVPPPPLSGSPAPSLRTSASGPCHSRPGGAGEGRRAAAHVTDGRRGAQGPRPRPRAEPLGRPGCPEPSALRARLLPAGPGRWLCAAAVCFFFFFFSFCKGS